MQNPWGNWNQHAGQAQINQAMLMNYQMMNNQGFNPSAMSPVQLQQFQQWQQQYQVWQAQYGQKYMETVNAMQQASQCNPPLPPNSNPPPPPPAVGAEPPIGLPDAKKNFDKEYRDWEEQYEKWKKDNEGHPDQAQYKEYEAQWENMRKTLNARREELKRKIDSPSNVPQAPPVSEGPSGNERPRPLMGNRPSAPANRDHNFPPSNANSAVSAGQFPTPAQNDKRFGRQDNRGRGRGGRPNRGRGGFSGNWNTEPAVEKEEVMNDQGGEQRDGNWQGDNFDNRRNFNNKGQNSNQPWGRRGANTNPGFNEQGQNFNRNEGPGNRNFGPNNPGPNFNDGGNWQRNRDCEGSNFRRGGDQDCGPNRGQGNWAANNFNEPPNNQGGGPFPDGPGNNGPPQFHDGPGNCGPNQFNDGPGNRGPNQFNEGPGNRGPNMFNREGQPNQNSGNRGFNQFNDGPGNQQHQFVHNPGNFGPQGPMPFNDGPGNRGLNNHPNRDGNQPNAFNADGPGNFNDGPGNRGPFCDESGNWGPNQFSDGFGNRGPNDRPGNRGPNDFFDGNRGNRGSGAPGKRGSKPSRSRGRARGPNGPGNRGPGNQGPNNFNPNACQFSDGPGFNYNDSRGGNANTRLDDRNFNEGNQQKFEDFSGNNEKPDSFWNDVGSSGFNRGRNDNAPERRNADSRENPNNCNFNEGPSQNNAGVISPALLQKIPSLLDMPLMNIPKPGAPSGNSPSEPSQLSGFVGSILAKLGVAASSPSPISNQEEPKSQNDSVQQEQEQASEPDPDPEPEWKPQVFDYSNKAPLNPSPVTELQFEVKDYGHTATKRTFEYGHGGGGNQTTRTFDYGHGGDRGLRSFDYGHGGRTFDYGRREQPNFASNDTYRSRYPDRSPMRMKRSRSRSPRKNIRKDFNENKKRFFDPKPKPTVSQPTPDFDNKPALQAVLVEDLILAPGRLSRPQNIVFIMRGISGSGKSYVTRLIKEKEIELGGAPPRILSLDDYFMVESDEEVKDVETGLKKKIMKYEYDEAMESVYQAALSKAFKKTISDGFFQFIIVDAMNKNAKEVEQMWSFAKQKGFQVYICEMDCDVATCYKRNIHNRTEKDVEIQAKDWESVSPQYLQLDVRSLLQSEAIDDVVMEDVDGDEAVKPEEVAADDQQVDDEDEPTVSHFLKSKWDDFQSSALKLDLLDGVSKKKSGGTTIEEYLAADVEDDWPEVETNPTGKKRVRWADVEEKRQQNKMRAIGFVVGQTDWNRMMDPSSGESALTKTKYI